MGLFKGGFSFSSGILDYVLLVITMIFIIILIVFSVDMTRKRIYLDKICNLDDYNKAFKNACKCSDREHFTIDSEDIKKKLDPSTNGVKKFFTDVNNRYFKPIGNDIKEKKPVKEIIEEVKEKVKEDVDKNKQYNNQYAIPEKHEIQTTYCLQNKYLNSYINQSD